MEALSHRLGVVEEIDSQAEAGRNEVIASNSTKIGCLAADQRWCLTSRVTKPKNFHGPHFTGTRPYCSRFRFRDLKPAGSDSDVSYMVNLDAHRRRRILEAQKEVVSPHYRTELDTWEPGEMSGEAIMITPAFWERLPSTAVISEEP